MTTIQCLCGAVKVALEGDALAHFYCHCDDCQAMHGAAYLGAALYRSAQVQVVAGEPFVWQRKSSPRTTCGTCGTRLFAEPHGLGIRSVTATLLPPGWFAPTFHMQCQHAIIPVRDELPHYRGYAPLFGGPDERMPW